MDKSSSNSQKNSTESTQAKQYKSLSDLQEWKENPRTITREGLENLKTKLNRYGQLDPLMVLEDGTVIGGNMRLKAMYELEWKEAWVNVVKPKSKKETIEMALAHNDHDGKYIEGDLSTLLADFDPEELAHFTVHLGDSLSLDKMMQPIDPSEITTEELKPYKKTHVLLSFDPKLMDKLSPLLEQIKEIGGVEYETGSN